MSAALASTSRPRRGWLRESPFGSVRQQSSLRQWRSSRRGSVAWVDEVAGVAGSSRAAGECLCVWPRAEIVVICLACRVQLRVDNISSTQDFHRLFRKMAMSWFCTPVVSRVIQVPTPSCAQAMRHKQSHFPICSRSSQRQQGGLIFILGRRHQRWSSSVSSSRVEAVEAVEAAAATTSLRQWSTSRSG